MRSSIPSAAVAVMLLSGCGGGGGDGGTPPNPVRHPAAIALSISSTDPMLSFGDNRTLTAVVTDSSAAVIEDATVSWISSAPGIVSVIPSTGLSITATAVSDGPATITATSGTVSASRTTSVQQKFAGVGVSPATVPLTVGGNQQLTAVARDGRGNPIAGASGFTFSSNNESVATVTPSGGFVSAVAAGTAIITATLTRDAVTAGGTATVNVTTSSFPSSATVATTDNAFQPPSVDITVGGTVTWNFGPTAHNVNFSGSGAPSNIGTTSSSSVERTFPTAGSFPYLCNLHAGMTATVVVH
jgi:plastocyanin